MASREGKSALEALARQVRRIERGGGVGRAEPRPVATGWAALDGLLGAGAPGGSRGGLARGAVHEWLGLDDAAGAERMRGGLAAWTPPLSVLVELARRALESREREGRPGWVVWLGARVWPYPRVLGGGGSVRVLLEGEAEDERALDRARGGGPLEGLRVTLELDPEGESGGPDSFEQALFERSLFVDPADLEARVWAADGALRCPTVAAVVMDGRGLRMPASRRLQLAAEAGGGFGLVARPADEAREVSAATSRWRVRRAAPTAAGAERDPSAARPRWELELLRLKAGLDAGGDADQVPAAASGARAG